MTIDRQKAAFIKATESDWTRQTELLQGTVVHEPDDPDAEPIREPEEWHAQGWDAEREPPKTIAQAREALAARIADTNAPDTDAVANAYDDLED
jgi:hypothetical protein